MVGSLKHVLAVTAMLLMLTASSASALEAMLGLGVVGDPNIIGDPNVRQIVALLIGDPGLTIPCPPPATACPPIQLMRIIRLDGGPVEVFDLDCVELTFGDGITNRRELEVHSATLFASGISIGDPQERRFFKVVDRGIGDPNVIGNPDQFGVDDPNAIPSPDHCGAADVVASPLLAGDFLTISSDLPQ